MPKRIIPFLGREKYTIAIFSMLFASMLFISNENLLQQFTPRRMCMFGNEKLIGFHLIADGAIAISYVVIGTLLYKIYKTFKDYKIPWKGYLWMYAGFIGFCGITHAMSVLNMWVTFYWVDGLIKMATAIFSASVAVLFYKDSKNIRQMKGSEDYTKLTMAYEKLLAQYAAIQNLHSNDATKTK